MLALVASSCDDEAEPSAKAVSFSAESAEVDEDAYDITLGLTLDAPASQDVDVDLTFGGTATQGVDYIAPEDSKIRIYKGQSTAAIPLRIVQDCVGEGAETIVVSLASAGNLSVSGSNTVTIAANSQFFNKRFLGRYKADEPGYAIYVVHFAENANANEIEIDNFWDSGVHMKYQFDLNSNAVTIPPQEFTISNVVYVVSSPPNSPGTYNPCTGEFKAPYQVRRKSNNALIDLNEHSYWPY